MAREPIEVDETGKVTAVGAPEAKHTPTPWALCRKPALRAAIVDCTSEYRIAWCNGRADADGEDNAAYIVKACNAHPELVAALRRIAGQDYEPVLTPAGQQSWTLAAAEIARAALEKAGEGEEEVYDGVAG